MQGVCCNASVTDILETNLTFNRTYARYDCRTGFKIYQYVLYIALCTAESPKKD